MLPPKLHDLAEPATGEKQQAHGGDARRHLDPLFLDLVQHLAQAPQLGGAEEPLALPLLQQTTLCLQQAGVTLLAGTNIAADGVPGFSLHDGLDLLADAGLTPLQLLQAAILNPPKVIHRTADYGTIGPGKIADMLLLEGDPVCDARALHRIAAVVLNGELLDLSALDKVTADAEREARQVRTVKFLKLLI